jgi:hypothetical protein
MAAPREYLSLLCARHPCIFSEGLGIIDPRNFEREFTPTPLTFAESRIHGFGHCPVQDREIAQPRLCRTLGSADPSNSQGNKVIAAEASSRSGGSPARIKSIKSFSFLSVLL